MNLRNFRNEARDDYLEAILMLQQKFGRKAVASRELYNLTVTCKLQLIHFLGISSVIVIPEYNLPFHSIQKGVQFVLYFL